MNVSEDSRTSESVEDSNNMAGLQAPSVCSLVFDDQLSCIRVGLVDNAHGSSSGFSSVPSSRCNSSRSRLGRPTTADISASKLRRYSFDLDSENGEEASQPSLKVRRATDLLRVTRVQMHRKSMLPNRGAKPHSRRQSADQGPPMTSPQETRVTEPTVISIPAAEVVRDVTRVRTDGPVDVIKFLNIDDVIDKPNSPDGGSETSRLRLFGKKVDLHEHDYQRYERVKRPVSSQPLGRSPVQGDISAAHLSRTAQHLNDLAQRAGRSVKFMKRMIYHEPPDAFRIDTQIIDYSVETDGLRECKDMQSRLQRQGVDLPLETLKKGLLPPTQYGFYQRQVKTLPEGKTFNYSDGLFSHPSTWMPAHAKLRPRQPQQLRPYATGHP